MICYGVREKERKVRPASGQLQCTDDDREITRQLRGWLLSWSVKRAKSRRVSLKVTSGR